MSSGADTSSAIGREARDLLRRASPTVRPGSRKEYLCALLANAVTALDRGDYAIAAVAAVRHQGLEIISVDANSLFSASDPRGHAEANAVSRLLGLTHAAPRNAASSVRPWPGLDTLGEIANGIYVRPLPELEDDSPSILYTSLEPCPMCTVVTLNAGIRRVWVAGRDDDAGSLAADGVHDMPPLWSAIQRAQGMDVDYFDPEAETDSDVHSIVALARQLFAASRARLDDDLSRGGLLALGGVDRTIENLQLNRISP